MKQSKVTGIVCTVTLHLLVTVLLFSLKLSVPEEQEEGGVSVMLGDTGTETEGENAYLLTEVDVQTSTESSSDDMPMIVQEEESPMEIKKQPYEEESLASQENVRKEKTEAELRAEKEREAAKAAADKIAGAFGKGSGMRHSADSDNSHTQGSATGSGDKGKTSGTGGIGVFDLQGRSLGTGSLPVPVYDEQDEGRVVVTIVVNPAGDVIRTSINKRTNTVNPALRKAAMEAAQKARFNRIDGVDNQSGTITYYFKLK